jgi:hypothetical protein
LSEHVGSFAHEAASNSEADSSTAADAGNRGYATMKLKCVHGHQNSFQVEIGGWTEFSVLPFRDSTVMCGRPCSRDIPELNAGPADGVDVAWLLRTIRSVVPHNVEDGERIEIARMQ